MDASELPAIYQSADSGSNAAQRGYLCTVQAEYFLLAVAALFGSGMLDGEIEFAALLVVLIALFGLLIFRFVSRLDRKWYACRALAESIKTSAWKFCMRAHPFEDSENISIPTRNLLNLINEIRSANEFIGGDLDAVHSDKDQISDKMFEVRKLEVPDRLQFYLNNRVKSQRSWYAKKAGWNKRRRVIWFCFAIIAYLLAGLVAYSPFLGYDISQFFSFLIVIVTSSFAWIQVKRHGELAASYSLTAHEIGTIQGLAQQVETEAQLSDFVNAAEFAFSREHTQWAARRESV